jgi:hypothetical protein
MEWMADGNTDRPSIVENTHGATPAHRNFQKSGNVTHAPLRPEIGATGLPHP